MDLKPMSYEEVLADLTALYIGYFEFPEEHSQELHDAYKSRLPYDAVVAYGEQEISRRTDAMTKLALTIYVELMHKHYPHLTELTVRKQYYKTLRDM